MLFALNKINKNIYESINYERVVNAN
jgi:hypothetical protein